jgi:pilus assembly protein CpaF
MRTFELQVIDSDGVITGEAARLSGTGTISVGRIEPAELKLNYPEVSKQHLRLSYDVSAGIFAVVDLGSVQGTYVDGQRVDPNQEYTVRPEQEIRVGRVMLRIIQRQDDEIPETPMTRLEPEPVPPDPIHEPGRVDHEQPPARATANPLIPQIQELLLQRVDFVNIVEQAEDDEQAREYVREQIGYIIHELIRKGRVSDRQSTGLEREAVQDILGFGPLQDLLDNPRVSEVMVNRADQIYYELDGRIRMCDRAFQSEDHVRQILMRMLRFSSRRIDEANPTVNARLNDGSRLHAVISPLSLDGTVITIRKFHHNLNIEQMVEYGSLTPPMARFVELACQERQNIVISGGTGSGKTTILNCLSTFIPGSERIITVEDTAELALRQRHVIRLQSRPANTEGTGAFPIQRLVVEALRMRPDRIIVGECRHGEALDMLQAMNTGHDGSMTTLHANSARDALSRIETMVLMSGLDLPVSAIRQQIASAVNLIIHAGRMADGGRKVLEIVEVTGIEEGRILLQPVFRFQQQGLSPDGRVIGQHAPTGHICAFLKRMGEQGKPIPSELFEIHPEEN